MGNFIIFARVLMESKRIMLEFLRNEEFSKLQESFCITFVPTKLVKIEVHSSFAVC